jgi:lipopolysaccharide export system permease protein
MTCLTRYLNRMVLVRFAVVLFAVAGFAVLFDLLDVGNRVTRRSELAPALAILRYVGIRLPSLLTDLLPLVTLVGALLAVIDLLRHRELVAIWAAGETRAGTMLRLWPLALVLVLGKFAIDDIAVPRTIPELREVGVGEFRIDMRPGGDLVWLRSGDDIIRLPAAAAATGELHDILIFVRDERGRLQSQISARSAEATDGGWLLHDVLTRPAGATPAQAEAQRFWPVRVDLSKVALMAKLPRELSWLTLRDVVRNQGWGIMAVDGHATWLHGRIAATLAPALMVFLAFALARRFGRTGAILPIFLKGIGIGFVYMIGNGMLIAFGEVGLMDPIAAAWTAPLLLAAVTLWQADLMSARAPRATSFHAVRSGP